MSQISKRVRDQIRTFLAASDGFNFTLESVSSTYGITPFSINFGAGSFNFFQGQVDPRQLEATSVIKYPLICLFSQSIEDDNEQKFQLFSGKVNMILDVHMNFQPAKALLDFESMDDAIEDTIVQIMNRQSNQTWDMETVYNGNVSLARFPVSLGATNWRQTLRFKLAFEVNEQS